MHYRPFLPSLAAILFGSLALEARSQTPFCEDLKPLTAGLAQGLNLEPTDPVSFLAYDEDGRYGLPLREFWQLLATCLKEGPLPRAVLLPRVELPGVVPLKRAMSAAKSNQAADLPAAWKLASVNLWAECEVERAPLAASLRIKVLDSKADSLLTVVLPDFLRLAGHPGISGDLIRPLRDADRMDLAEARQNAIERIEMSPAFRKSPGTLPGHAFRFVKEWKYADEQQVDQVKRVLKNHFGFRIEDGAADAIALTPDGSLEFRAGKRKIRVDSLVDGRSMLDAKALWDIDGYFVPPASAGKTDKGFYVRFKTVSDQYKDLGDRIRNQVELRLAEAYRLRDADGRFADLRRIFKGNQKTILRGNVQDSRPGQEQVQYYWETPQEYIASLEQRARNGQTFDVRLGLMRLYQKEPNSHRFWGLVKQTWITRSPKGRRIGQRESEARYQDEGFLFINFNVDPKTGRMDALEVHHRLWFYHYRHDKQVKDGKVARVMKPYERLEGVIDMALSTHAPLTENVKFGEMKEGRFEPTDNARGIGGPDWKVLQEMKSDLVASIRNACCSESTASK